MPQTDPTRHEIYNDVTKDAINYERLQSSFGDGEIPDLREEKIHENGTKTSTLHPLHIFGIDSKLLQNERGQLEFNDVIDVISIGNEKITYRDARNALRFEQAFHGKHPGGIVLGKDKKTPIGFVEYTPQTIAERIKNGNDPTGDYENILVKKHSVFIKEQGKQGANRMTQAEKTIYDYEGNVLEHSRKVLVGKKDAQGNLEEPTEAECRQKLNESVQTIISKFNGEDTDVLVFRDIENQGKEYIKEGYEVRISNKDGKREIQITAKEFAHEQPPRKVTIELQQTPDGKIATDVSKIFVEVDGKRFDVAEGDYAFFSQFFTQPAEKHPNNWEERKKQIDANPEVIKEREKTQKRLNEILTDKDLSPTSSDINLIRGEIYKNLTEIDAVKNPELYMAYDSVLKIFNNALLNRETAVQTIENSEELKQQFKKILELKTQSIINETKKSLQQAEEKRTNNVIPFQAAILVNPSIFGEKHSESQSILNIYLLSDIPDINYREEYTNQEIAQIADSLFKSADSYLLKTEKDKHQNLEETQRQKIIIEFIHKNILQFGIKELQLKIDEEIDEAIKTKLQQELKLKQQLLASFQPLVTP